MHTCVNLATSREKKRILNEETNKVIQYLISPAKAIDQIPKSASASSLFAFFWCKKIFLFMQVLRRSRTCLPRCSDCIKSMHTKKGTPTLSSKHKHVHNVKNTTMSDNQSCSNRNESSPVSYNLQVELRSRDSTGQ